MARTERYFVGPSLLRDIRRTISRVGEMPYSTSGARFDAVLQSLPIPGGTGTPHRLCKTTAAFTKGTIATLNVWEDCDPPNEQQTPDTVVENVVNKFADIGAGKFVSVARHGNGRWYVVAAECG